MNEREDPPPGNRPAPYHDPPERPLAGPEPGGPPAEPIPPPGQPETPADARWEHVVDPEPVTSEAAPAEPPAAREWPEPRVPRAPAQRAAAAPPAATAMADDEYDDDYDDYEDEPVSRWVSLLATIGTALIGIVTVQVVTSLIEGFALQSGQRVGVQDDLFHRLGYPFGGLGTTALVILVLGIVLVALPSVLGELLSEAQDRVVGAALFIAIGVGVIIAIGSLLAVRANLHEYAAKDIAVPTYVRIQFTNFLLGSLGAAALALFGAIAAINERSRERYD